MESFKEENIPHNLAVATNGEEAMKILHKECKHSQGKRPKLIILDLNLPKKSGREVLKEIKSNDALKKIPVIILTTSTAENDIEMSYNNHANAYLTKPVDLNNFIEVVKSIQDFWIKKVKLPKN